jgi:hypothetical protein
MVDELDVAALDDCVQSVLPADAHFVRSNVLRELGLSSTPTTILRNRVFVGFMSVAEIERRLQTGAVRTSTGK